MDYHNDISEPTIEHAMQQANQYCLMPAIVPRRWEPGKADLRGIARCKCGLLYGRSPLFDRSRKPVGFMRLEQRQPPAVLFQTFGCLLFQPVSIGIC